MVEGYIFPQARNVSFYRVDVKYFSRQFVLCHMVHLALQEAVRCAESLADPCGHKTAASGKSCLIGQGDVFISLKFSFLDYFSDNSENDDKQQTVFTNH